MQWASAKREELVTEKSPRQAGKEKLARYTCNGLAQNIVIDFPELECFAALAAIKHVEDEGGTFRFWNDGESSFVEKAMDVTSECYAVVVVIDACKGI